MQAIVVRRLVFAGYSLRLFASGKAADKVVSAKNRRTVLGSLEQIREDYEVCQLPMTLVAVSRLVREASQPSFTYGQVASSCTDVLNRMMDELDTRLFLAVDAEKASYYQDFAEEWEQVIARFPAVAFDVEEACKCLALNRYTGCVYHVMRIGEGGLTEVAKRIGLEGERRNWLGIIGYIEGQLKKNLDDMDAVVKGNVEFFGGVAAHMRTVNIAWRRRVAHIESKYTEEEAERIYATTKVLMEHLATELPEAEAS